MVLVSSWRTRLWNSLNSSSRIAIPPSRKIQLSVMQKRLRESALAARDARLAERLLKGDPSLARTEDTELVELASPTRSFVEEGPDCCRPPDLFGR